MEKNEHYVYMVIDKETFDAKYIGKGKGDRCYEILSGMSSNYEANKAYHTGKADNCVVYEVYTELSNVMALDIEKAMIYTMQPEWNSDHKYILPNADMEYFMVGFRMNALITMFKGGLWKHYKDRVALILGLSEVMRCHTLDEVNEHIEYVWGDQDTIIRENVLRLWKACTAAAEEEFSDKF